MFGRSNKTYFVSMVNNRTGFKETMEMDTKDLRRYVQMEMEEATFKKGPNGRAVAVDYPFKITNIHTPYLSGRDVEFFAPGISKVDKYTDKASGYFIKDTRSNFKALAPGTHCILVFGSREEATQYYQEHQQEIEQDYIDQKDSYFDLDDVVYESVIYANDQKVGSLNLSGRGRVFPESNIYHPEDIENMKRMVSSYENFNASHEYAQNLRFTSIPFRNFVDYNLGEIGQNEVYLDLDRFDPGFKPTFENFVHQYPEMVNRDIIISKEREEANNRIRLKFDSLKQSAEQMAVDHGLATDGADNQLSDEDDIVY